MMYHSMISHFNGQCITWAIKMSVTNCCPWNTEILAKGEPGWRRGCTCTNPGHTELKQPVFPKLSTCKHVSESRDIFMKVLTNTTGKNENDLVLTVQYVVIRVRLSPYNTGSTYECQYHDIKILYNSVIWNIKKGYIINDINLCILNWLFKRHRNKFCHLLPNRLVCFQVHWIVPFEPKFEPYCIGPFPHLDFPMRWSPEHHD